jgi:hypothetical protein
MEAMKKSMGVQSHYTTVYNPHANGAAEIVNKHILECIRQMALQTGSHSRDWPLFVKNIQSFINVQESEVLGGASPMEVFLGRKPKGELKWMFKDRSVKSASMEVSRSEELKSAVEGLKKEFERRNVRVTRAQALKRRANIRLAQGRSKLEELEIGDLVVAVFPWKHSGKTMARWKGPFKISRIVGPMRYVIRSLYSDKEFEMHTACLRKFRSKDCVVLEKWKEMAEFEEGGFNPERIKGFMMKDDQLWAQVVWSGKHAETWELLDSMLEDHLTISVEAIRKNLKGKIEKSLKDGLELKLAALELSSVGSVDTPCSLTTMFS